MNKKYLSVYKNGTISEEPVVFIEKDGRAIATLSERPIAILQVYNPITNEYLDAEDFSQDGRILLRKSDKIRFLREEWLHAKNLPEDIKNTGEEYKIFDILLIDVPQLASFQYRVTYTAEAPRFPSLTSFPKALSTFRERVKSGKKAKVVLYGDSISNAANSSGEGQFPPYEKEWYFQAMENIRAYYKNDGVSLVNNSRSGYGSVWGAENAFEKVEEAQLLIVAFGMNDASDNLSCEEFEKNVRAILKARKNSDCNVVLISSILPHPDSELFRLSLRKEYGEALKRICVEENCAFMDMLAISEYYLQTKNYCEISGNNFNHPNDFIYRFYADALTYLLTQEEI